MGLAVMKPVRTGFLANLPQVMREALASTGIRKPDTEWALDYLWDIPEVSVAVSGMGSMADVEENLRYAAKARPNMLSPAEREALGAAIYAYRHAPGHIDCTGCYQCIPCPHNVAIGYIFAYVYNNYILHRDKERAMADYTVSMSPVQRGDPASSCIACGECLATLVFTSTCSEDDPIQDGQEQTTPEEDDGEEGNEGNNEEGGNVEGGSGRYLVLYCSRTGNTERMAQTIQSALDCAMIVVEPDTPYEDDYNAMLDRAQAELDAIEQGDYPVITTSVESFDEYDVVFIGYPIWYSHIATPMQTFLHNHADMLAGKRIALFASSGSSGIGTSERDAATLVPDAVFEESLLLTSSTLGSMATRIPQWLESLGASRE